MSMTSHSIRERGQVVVLFALLIPVFLGLGSIVLSVGNWYVHKKHLQTLVDAGAFAAGPDFSACYQDPTTTNTTIAQSAVEYAGDTLRDSATRNLQEQEPDDVRVVLNSTQYWGDANGMDPDSPSPGYGLDYSLPPVDDAGDPTIENNSLPCSVKFLDVKATDHEAPLLFRWIPLYPSPKAKARVAIRKVEALNGLLPWAVPETNPARVAAIIVNENAPVNDANGVRGAAFLNQQSGQSGVWAGDLMDVGLNGNNNFNTVILISRSTNVSLSGSLQAICNQNPVQTKCYSGGTMTSGMSFIRVHPATTPAVDVGEVQLADATCLNDSAPYFVLDEGCRVSISRAVVNFGVSGDPTGMPTCGRVSSPGGALQWVDSGGIGHWETTGSFPLNNAGRNAITLTVRVKTPTGNSCNQSTTVATRLVAAPYVAGDNSGPVISLTVHKSGVRLGSAEQDSDASLSIRVGLIPPLEVTDQWNDPPVYLRLTTNSSANQAVNCDDGNISGPAGNHSNFRNEIEDGCYTFYRANGRNGDCSNYGSGTLPPATTLSNPIDDCVINEPGLATGQIRQALEARFGGNPCKTLNNWPQNAGDAFPTSDDPRLVTLFIVDETSFVELGGGRRIMPIRTFGAFYITGGDGLNCPGDDPPPPGTRQASAWGHFVTYAVPNPDAIVSEELCEFNEVGVCVARLVE